MNLLAAIFLYSPGTEDVGTLYRWTTKIATLGLSGGFAQSGVDYPPLAFVFLAAIAHCADVLGASWFFVLKLSIWLFLIATSTCFYWFTRNLILTAAFEFTLILNSVALAYIDVYFAVFLIAGLFHLQRGNLNRGFLLFAISCVIKWQPLIIAPFICIYVLAMAKEGSSGRSKLQRSILPFAVPAVAVGIPIFALFGASVFDSLGRAMFHNYPDGDYLSANALNLSWIHTWALHLLQPDKYEPLIQGQVNYVLTSEWLVRLPEKILFYASYVVVLIVFARQKKTFERLIVYSTLGYMCYFILNTGVHENHLFLASCLAWVLVFLNSDYLLYSINLNIAANANLLLFYGVFGQPLPFTRVVAGVDITLWFTLANLCLFLGLLVHTFKADGVGVRFWRTSKRDP